MIRNYWTISILAVGIFVISGCVNHSPSSQSERPLDQKANRIAPSYLQTEAGESESERPIEVGSGAQISEATTSDGRDLTRLKPMDWPAPSMDSREVLESRFSNTAALQLSAEKMPLIDFLHYVFGELLDVNYVFDQSIAESNAEIGKELVTLKITDEMSPRELFKLASNLLADRGLQIKYGSNIFYIHAAEEIAGSQYSVIGVGGDVGDVPNTTRPILQVVPLKFGAKVSVERSLSTFGRAKIVTDYDQGAVFITGNRSDVLQAVELIKLIDTPSARSKFVGLIELTFVSPEEFSQQVALLLDNEGVTTAVGRPSQRGLTLVPLKQLGAIAVFASTDILLQRVEYWSTVLDVPGKGSQEQYFLYHPTYARAKDLGESVRALLGVGGTSSNSSSGDTGNQQLSTGNAPSSDRRAGLNTEKIKMVVDERANDFNQMISCKKHKRLNIRNIFN